MGWFTNNGGELTSLTFVPRISVFIASTAKKIMMKIILTSFFILAMTRLAAQNKIHADSGSVTSINGIMKEMLRLVSVEKGKQRNWEGFRNLFLPTAQFTVVNHGESISKPVETVGLEEFISLMHDPYYDSGYLESEISKVVNEYNGIANVFQTFHGRDSEGVEENGINSYQLVYFNNRWWIANLVWTIENNGVKIPKKYLKK